MHELTMQTFWGTPLALLPSAILLTWIVQLRVTGLLSPGPGATLGTSAAERARVLNKASLGLYLFHPHSNGTRDAHISIGD